MIDLPLQISFVRVRDALGSLGLPVDDIQRADFSRHGLTVEMVRVDEENRAFGFGDDVCVVTTQIAYDMVADL